MGKAIHRRGRRGAEESFVRFLRQQLGDSGINSSILFSVKVTSGFLKFCQDFLGTLCSLCVFCVLCGESLLDFWLRPWPRCALFLSGPCLASVVNVFGGCPNVARTWQVLCRRFGNYGAKPPSGRDHSI